MNKLSKKRTISFTITSLMLITIVTEPTHAKTKLGKKNFKNQRYISYEFSSMTEELKTLQDTNKPTSVNIGYIRYFKRKH